MEAAIGGAVFVNFLKRDTKITIKKKASPAMGELKSYVDPFNFQMSLSVCFNVSVTEMQ